MLMRPAQPTPQVHPEVASDRLLAAMTVMHLQRHLAFQIFLEKVLSPVELSE